MLKPVILAQPNDAQKRYIISQKNQSRGFESLLQLKPETSLPLRKVGNDEELTFSYDTNGRLQTKKSNVVLEKYFYDQFNRLTKFERRKNGKAADQFKFSYAANGNLSLLKSRGQRVSLNLSAIVKDPSPASTQDRLLSLKSFSATAKDRTNVQVLLSALEVLNDLQSFSQGSF